MSKHDHTPHLPRRKRSGRLTLAMMGASAFGLTACGQPPQEEQITEIEFDEPRSLKALKPALLKMCIPVAPVKMLTKRPWKPCRAIARWKSVKLRMVKALVAPQPKSSLKRRRAAPAAVGLCPP